MVSPAHAPQTVPTTRCPVTGCTRDRGPRPLCNAHIRRVGRTLVTQYFDAVNDPIRSSRRQRLAELLPKMIDHAEQYDRVRAEGLHPVWDTDTEQWCNPRDRARRIIDSFALFDLRRPHDIDDLVKALYPRKRTAK